jgi:hypothetical protein
VVEFEVEFEAWGEDVWALGCGLWAVGWGFVEATKQRWRKEGGMGELGAEMKMT